MRFLAEQVRRELNHECWESGSLSQLGAFQTSGLCWGLEFPTLLDPTAFESSDEPSTAAACIELPLLENNGCRSLEGTPRI